MILEGDGGTMALDGSDLPRHGYYVGGSKAGASFLGWWKDSETGLIHLDWVDHCNTLWWAEKLGRKRGEIAIYDIANAKEIRL